MILKASIILFALIACIYAYSINSDGTEEGQAWKRDMWKLRTGKRDAIWKLRTGKRDEKGDFWKLRSGKRGNDDLWDEPSDRDNIQNGHQEQDEEDLFYGPELKRNFSWKLRAVKKSQKEQEKRENLWHLRAGKK